MEIIEIGAVMLDEKYKDVREFDTFVRPIANPVLSTFCTQLTTIQQSNIDGAPPFPVALASGDTPKRPMGDTENPANGGGPKGNLQRSQIRVNYGAPDSWGLRPQTPGI
jgi:hypothetical protein